MVVKFNYRKHDWGRGDSVNVAKYELKGDHVSELHDCVHDYGCDHGAGDADKGKFDFVGHVENSVESYEVNL